MNGESASSPSTTHEDRGDDSGRPLPRWPWIPWMPLALSVLAAVLLWIIDPPMRDLQAALARESAHRAGVGVSYWFDWFGGVSPGSYSLIVPTLTSWVGSLFLLCLCTVIISALAYPVSRNATHPTLLTWAVALSAVLNMFSGRVTFATGAAIAMLAVWAFQRKRPVTGALLLVVSGLASALVPAFVGMVLLPFFLVRRYRNARMWWAIGGAALGVALPYLLFGAPGQQPYPVTSFLWYLVIGIGAVLALDSPMATNHAPARWIAPLGIVVATVLFIIPTGVGSNLGRFFLFILPCVVLFFSLKSPKVLALLLSPALVYGLFYALYDQVSVTDGENPETLYAPLTSQLDELADDGRIENHRVELVDTDTHAGAYLLTDSAPLARGWENQSDMRYNSVFFDKDALHAASRSGPHRRRPAVPEPGLGQRRLDPLRGRRADPDSPFPAAPAGDHPVGDDGGGSRGRRGRGPPDPYPPEPVPHRHAGAGECACHCVGFRVGLRNSILWDDRDLPDDGR